MGIVVVVVVVVVGATVVTGVCPVGEFPGTVEPVVEPPGAGGGGAAVTLIDCEIAAGAYVSVPAWLADTRHVPGARKVTTSADNEHTDDEELATAKVAAKKASLVTVAVQVPPTMADDGAVFWKRSTWVILLTVTVCVVDTGL